MSKDNQKIEDFDFAKVNEDSEEREEEGTSETVITKLKGVVGNKAKEIKKLKKQIATSGSLTPKLIKEARELAESKKGLNIDEFMQKNRLINVDIEQLLHAPLKKDGSFI